MTLRLASAALAAAATVAAVLGSTQLASAQPGPTPTFVSELGPASVVTPTQPPATDTPEPPPTATAPRPTASPTAAATSEVAGAEQAPPAGDGSSDSSDGPLGTMVVVAAVLIAAMLATGAFFALRANRR